MSIPTLHVVFPSWDAALDHAASAPLVGEWTASNRPGAGLVTHNRHGKVTHDDPTFYGTPDKATAVALARTGWPEGFTPCARFLADVVPTITRDTLKPDVSYVESDGAMIDVGRFTAGEPACWQTWVDDDRPAPIVDLYVALHGAMKVTGTTYQRRGATVLALVECLEFAGRSVSVTGVKCNIGKRSPNPIVRWDVPVKRAGEALNPGRLAFALTHASMNRRLGWAWMEALPPALRDKFTLTYGSPWDEFSVPDGALKIPDVTADAWWSDATARTFLLATLRAQGVTLRDTEDTHA